MPTCPQCNVEVQGKDYICPRCGVVTSLPPETGELPWAEPRGSSLDDGTSRAKRWGRKGFLLGTFLSLLGVAVSAINDGFSDPIVVYLVRFLILAAVTGGFLAMMGFG